MICLVGSCGKKVIARGLCGKHYKRFMSTGNPVGLKIERHGNQPRGHPSPEYIAWEGMKARCENRNSKDYPRYGGSGIKVCDRWKKSFLDFLQDMGERPLGKSLDRIDNNGNYELANCKWSTSSEQAKNRRKSNAKVK